MNVAQIIASTEAEGPGRRFAIWVQGCPLRCPGCCNPQMLRFDQEPDEGVMSPADLAERVLATENIDGVSLLGGEPFAQADGLAEVAERVRARGLDVMIYSGFTLGELREKAKTEGGVEKLLAQCDLLVDGPYDRDRPEHGSARPRRWIGSTNQGLHFLTDRYQPDDERLYEKNSVEIRLTKDGELVVNGWPQGAAAVGIKPFVRLRKKD